VDPETERQLAVLAWLAAGALAGSIAAIVALVRSGRTVPPLGGHSHQRPEATDRPRRASGA
jgi:hypothetical protein